MTLLYMVIAWLIGILVWSSAISPIGPWLTVAGFISAILLRKSAVGRQVGLYMLAAGLGLWRTTAAQPTNLELAAYNDKGYAEMEAVIVDAPDVRDNTVRLRVDVQSIRADGEDLRPIQGTALLSANRFGGYAYGDKIRIQGNPMTPPVFDTFSYRDYLARSGIYTYIPYAKVTILEHGAGSPILSAMFDIRERAHQLITRMLPSPQSALLTGILLGNDNDIPPEISDAFNQTGTTHIIAISGSNITIVAGLLMAIFSRLTDKRVAGLLMVVGITLYTLFVGASPSVVRAAIMASLAIIAQRVGRRSDGLTALAASVWFMTLLNPYTLFDMGLILSSAATLGLILFSQPLTHLAERVVARLFSADTARKVVDLLSEAILVTVAAQITTLPIIFLVFGRFSAVSFVVNALVIPAQAPIMSLGILAVIAGTIWLPIGQLIAWLVAIPVSYTLAIIRAMAQLPGASVPITLDPMIVVFYYVGLFSMTAVLTQPPETRKTLITRIRNVAAPSTIAVLGLAIAGLLWAMILSRPDGKLHVWFLSVGAGNAVLIQTPQGAHLLVDGGENPTQLRTAIGDRLPFYKQDVDVLFVTQPKKGTIAALPPLFDRYAVKSVITNGQSAQDDTYQALITAFDQAHPQIVTAVAGYRVQTDDGVVIDVVNPAQAPDPKVKPEDDPLVLRLTYGDASFLLTSDLSADAIKTLLGSRQYLGATVLELPSNGDEKVNTKEWLRAVSPQVAVVEAELGSPNAQPDEKVLKALQTINVYRTDTQGTVEIATDGKQLWVSTARQSN